MHIPSSTRIGVRNAVFTALYIVIVVTIMQATSHFSGKEVPYLMGFMALTLFVVSALVTGSLMLWTPVRLFLDGNRGDAARMLISSSLTLVALLIIAALVAVALR